MQNPPVLRKRLESLDPIVLVTFVLVGLALLALIATVSPAGASSGGVGSGGSGGPVEKAHLTSRGKAIAPDSAPARVKRAIRAANKIRKTKYEWGGGHGSFRDNGYDCSGAVSYMLHGGRMLKSPMDSSGLMHWGQKRKGKWITVYANPSHTYAVVAGLRWDTSGGPGPRWHKAMRSNSGFKVRHYRGY
jgi:hypothetical protein